MLTCPDAPKTLRFPEEREARIQALRLPHIATLTRLVRTIRAARGSPEDVPSFDPCDGGINARALFLLEAPGPKARFSGFISRNNPDETAKNLFELQREAGLPRELVVLWNIVPWYVGDGKKIRPVTRHDIEEASPWLDRLIELLPRLRAVILVGRKAQRAAAKVQKPGATVFQSLHPSPMALHARPAARGQILKVWREVALFIGTEDSGVF